MCIFSLKLRLKPLLGEAWARTVWKRSLLKRVARVELEWALYHWTIKFCNQGPFVCIPKITCNILLSWETFAEENVVSHAHPAMNFSEKELRGCVFHPGETNLNFLSLWIYLCGICNIWHLFAFFCWFWGDFETENRVYMGQNGKNLASSYFLKMVSRIPFGSLLNV